MIEWWTQRKETEVAWKVKVGDLKRGFDLDVKNPHRAEEDTASTSAEIINALKNSQTRMAAMLTEIESVLIQ